MHLNRSELDFQIHFNYFCQVVACLQKNYKGSDGDDFQKCTKDAVGSRDNSKAKRRNEKPKEEEAEADGEKKGLVNGLVTTLVWSKHESQCVLIDSCWKDSLNKVLIAAPSEDSSLIKVWEARCIRRHQAAICDGIRNAIFTTSSKCSKQRVFHFWMFQGTDVVSAKRVWAHNDTEVGSASIDKSLFVKQF